MRLSIRQYKLLKRTGALRFLTEMFTTKLFGIFALTSALVYAEVTTVVRRFESFPKAELTSDLHDGLVTYVTCYSLLDTKSSTKCKITHSTLYGENELASCDVNLEGKEDGKINVHSLNKENAVITWYSQQDSGPEHYIRYTIVNFNNCTTYYAQIGFDSIEIVTENINKYGNALLINSDDTFDVFFESSILCGNRVCRVRYNAEGQLIREPTPSFAAIDNLSEYAQAEPKSINDSFVITELEKSARETARLILVSLNDQQVLKEMEKTQLTRCSVSTRHEVIRVCAVTKPSSKINCEVYDITGNLTSQINVDIGHTITYLTIYNLANGEFMAKTQAKYEPGKIFFTKIEADGRRLGAVVLPKLECTQNDESFYADFEDYSSYCVTKLCYAPRHVELLRRCFDNEDF